MNDELALMEALHDLTTDQPTAPVDRFPAIRRRLVRRRVAMTSTAAVTAAVATVGALLIAGPLTANRAVPANRPVPSWALPWPDHRNGSASQRVLDGAVSAWRNFNATGHALPAPSRVIWYVGQRAVNNTEIVVVFEVDSAEGHRLVAGFAGVDGLRSASSYANGSTPWVFYDVPAPSPLFRGTIGLNLAQSGPVNSRSFKNWIVVLARPTARQIGWSGRGIAGGTATPDRGLVIANTGRPTGQVFASVVDRGDQVGGVSAFRPVGVPGSYPSRAPHMRAPEPLTDVPSGPRSMGAMAAQGDVSTDRFSFNHLGPTTIYARCYGTGPIRVAIDNDRSGAGVEIPCDGGQHVVPGGWLRTGVSPAGEHLVWVHANNFTAWRVAVVADR